MPNRYCNVCDDNKNSWDICSECNQVVCSKCMAYGLEVICSSCILGELTELTEELGGYKKELEEEQGAEQDSTETTK